jgi:serine/threonine-protein kinase
VHGDLKPSNVLVSPGGGVKLFDFGVGRIVDGDSGPAARAIGGVSAGFTPGFAAPERWRGDPASTATDVYSLGALLRRLLGGCASRERTRPGARRRRRRGRQRDLDAIVDKAVNQRPHARYESVATFADDIQRILEHRPISARPHTFGDRAATFVMRLAAACRPRSPR